MKTTRKLDKFIEVFHPARALAVILKVAILELNIQVVPSLARGHNPHLCGDATRFDFLELVAEVLYSDVLCGCEAAAAKRLVERPLLAYRKLLNLLDKPLSKASGAGRVPLGCNI